MIFPYFYPLEKEIELGICILLLSLFIIFIMLLIPHIYMKQCKWISEYLFSIGFIFCYIFAGVAYLPIFLLLMNIANEQNDNSEVASINLTIISVMGLLLLFIIGILYRIFIISPLINLYDPTAVLNPSPRIIFQISRTIISVISVIKFNNGKMPYILIIMIIVVSLIYYLRSLLYGVTFYNNETKIYNIVFASISLWLCAIACVKWIDENNFESEILNFALFSGGIGILGICKLKQQDLYPDLIHFSDNGFYNIVKACYSMLMLRENYLMDASHSNQFILTAYLFKHYEKCKFPRCPITRLVLSNNCNPYLNSSEITQTLLYSINRILKKLVIFQPDCIPAKLFYIAFLLKYMPENSILAWEIYYFSKKQNVNPLETYMLQYFGNELKSCAFIKNAESQINPLEMLRHLKTERKFIKILIENSVQYSHFWDLLQDASPIYEKFYNCGCRIIKNDKIIRSIWTQLLENKYKIGSMTRILYYKYKNEVQFDKTDLDDLSFIENFHRESLLNIAELEMDAGIISISAKAGLLGTILNANSCFCQLSGFTKEELRNSHQEKFIPSIFRELHQNAFEIECYFCECGIYRIHESKEKFLLNKSGYIIPISMQIVDGPSILNSYCFVGKIKRSHKRIYDYDNIHILCNPNGIITEISSSIFIIL